MALNYWMILWWKTSTIEALIGCESVEGKGRLISGSLKTGDFPGLVHEQKNVDVVEVKIAISSVLRLRRRRRVPMRSRSCRFVDSFACADIEFLTNVQPHG